MAAKNQSSQAYEPLPREDPSAALLSPSERDNSEDGQTPMFRFTFSPTLIVRLLTVPLIITDIVFLCMPRYSPGAAAVFAIFAIFSLFWHAYRVFNCFLPGRKSNQFDFKIGSFFCMFGTTAPGSGVSKRTVSCLVSAVDFSIGLLFIGPSVLSVRTGIWYYNSSILIGLSIAIVVLQSAIALFNLFSAFRKIKISVYMGEEENGRIQLSEEQFRDEMSEPRDSMSSEV
ncbi:hypothetical protein KAF25_001140 [Fusarium avenaceum]|uniref:Uncharacterized protein n=1 Tax=Fusarium avenaceum TaxID=40199 RepID=A0A9P7H6Q9_9HYPO|nr:hypothetical protein KAF25_001140 [Fusarium avenaceum]